MLAIGRALMARPRLLLLDEPSMGLAPVLVEQVFDIIQTINRQGTTILVVEQNAAVALSIAHRGYVLQDGRIVMQGAGGRRCSTPTTSAAPISGRTECWTPLGILPQQLVFGLALGAVYGLIALGYTMVYGILLMINFAHGELFMIGAYVGWAVLIWLINASLGGLHPIWVLPVLLLHGDVGVRHPGRDAGALRLSPAVHARRDPAGSADQCGGRVDLPAERGDAHARARA